VHSAAVRAALLLLLLLLLLLVVAVLLVRCAVGGQLTLRISSSHGRAAGFISCSLCAQAEEAKSTTSQQLIGLVSNDLLLRRKRSHRALCLRCTGDGWAQQGKTGWSP
jgi:hypothetical protein